MVAKLSEVASWIYQQTLATPGTALMQTTREFIRRYTTIPANVNAGYYHNVTRVKNWDEIMTDLWKCIPAVSDPTQRYPELLCYDASDVMIMIMYALGVETRSVRVISGAPLSFGPAGQPYYLDHTLVECWTGAMWAVQDPFYNVEFIRPSGGTYDWASADALCLADDLSLFTPKNNTKSGWVDTGAAPLLSQDFFAAIEHRDVGGGLGTVVNGQPCPFPYGKSVVVMNGARCDLDRGFYNPNTGLTTPLRQLVTGFTHKPKPTVIERPAP